MLLTTNTIKATDRRFLLSCKSSEIIDFLLFGFVVNAVTDKSTRDWIISREFCPYIMCRVRVVIISPR